MPIILNSPATPSQIKSATVDFGDYFKFVVDISRQVMTIGGLRHLEGQQLLLSHGSSPSDLWGGGVDWLTKQLDFASMINTRPQQNNPSREILSLQTRGLVTQIVKSLLLIP